jgi:hypothetical protein
MGGQGLCLGLNTLRLTHLDIVYCFHQNNDVARRSFLRQGHRADSRSLASNEMSFGGVCMSITTYLDDFDADLETKTVLGVALERTRVSLGLVDKFANGIIAKRLIELAKAGERNPDLLCEGALKKLRGHLYSD